MGEKPKFVNGKINPDWFERAWKSEASRVEAEQASLADEYLLDNCDLSLLQQPFDLNRYFKLAPKKKLENTVLRGVKIKSDNLRDCSLQGCDLRGAVFSRTDMGKLSISGCDFRFTKGIYGDRKAIWKNGLSDYRLNPPVFDRQVVRLYGTPVPVWSSIRSIGNLPLFGISNFTLIFLILYAGFGTWYNHQISRMDLLAHQVYDGDISAILGQLQLVPNPWPFGFLFISILSISFASGLFALRCPDPVKYYSPVQWEVAENEMIEYISANYDRPVSRWSCFALYLIGGSFAMPYLVYKSFQTMIFFFYN